jgi:hypothetical protein
MTFKDNVGVVGGRLGELGTWMVALLAIAVTAGAGPTTGSAPGQSAGPRSRYFGQTPTGLTPPERFAPGVVSTPAIEINGVFAPDFREFVFARRLEGVFTLFRSMFERVANARVTVTSSV